MCGITGFWRPGAASDSDRAHLRAMMTTLVHRGPDGDGMHLDPGRGLAMGHTRLAIIDLEHGDQPLRSADGNLVLTVNGELYDYKLHRTRLHCDGARFSTKTDAEIALHFHARHGLDFVHRLRGEFALVLFDAERERLVLVRDRFGIKPLYWSLRQGPDGDALYWGSEVKALLAHPEIPARLDSRAVLHQLMQVMVPGTTAFEGVHALRPGHMMVAQRVGDRLELSVSRYWDAEFPLANEHESDPDPGPWIEGVRERLIDAVRVRLEADVPVGCYLSGGIDSCSTLGLATAMQQSHVKAFTIAFEDDAYDESSIAAEMAKRAQADQVVMPLGVRELYGRYYERTAWHAERTFYNTLGVAKWHMSRTVHEHGYKVVITGEGSDELFGGYPFFKRDVLLHCGSPAEREALMQRLQQSNALFAGAILADRSHEHPAMNDLLGFTPSWIQPWIATLERVRPLLAPALREELEGYDPIEAIASTLDPASLRDRHPLDKAQYTWIQTMLEGQILTWGGDRVDMANSMESRPPFLDHLLAEFAFRVPPALRIRTSDGSLREKWVLREAMREVLPRVLYEREKFAFMAPPATVRPEEWAQVRPLVDEHLSTEAVEASGLFDPAAVAGLVDELHRGPDPSRRSRAVNDDIVLNHLLGLQSLHRSFVRGGGRPEL
ncbi:asparagine synthase (glutamine-hydrolyzing) [Paraliomyxa miuraensis]|uniref:asparagine synthase (glutamine-hydrolyzing) n=1 Tax=Paraliomyxa miuraensis TaxID=376150 RepID=UPI0022593CD1|nr:asparagine synthase (glutamine-hydrolyzing) [Paraliomyxa miuraensis]MCX4240853.1 asparagine synthase (glutamine-hydrolyzing) [Paraliomyxa miuraensis]